MLVAAVTLLPAGIYAQTPFQKCVTGVLGARGGDWASAVRVLSSYGDPVEFNVAVQKALALGQILIKQAEIRRRSFAARYEDPVELAAGGAWDKANEVIVSQFDPRNDLLGPQLSLRLPDAETVREAQRVLVRQQRFDLIGISICSGFVKAGIVDS
jgi:hypothetical protein